MKSLLAAAAVALVLGSSSCASIITGATDDILITSSPDGAYFRTNLGQSGRTPQSISIPDDQPLSVSFRLEGYEDQSASVGTRMSAWVLGNIVFGGLIGLVVDVAANGNVHKSDQVHVVMYPLPAPKTSRTAAIEARPQTEPRSESFDQWAARRTEDGPAQESPEL
jgi:hypothetical protein